MEIEQSARPSRQDVVTGDLDRLSLAQALIDFEIANGRVMDLTRRLIETQDQVRALEQRVNELQRDHTALQEVHHRVVTSRSYRLVEAVVRLRALTRPSPRT